MQASTRRLSHVLCAREMTKQAAPNRGLVASRLHLLRLGVYGSNGAAGKRPPARRCARAAERPMMVLISLARDVKAVVSSVPSLLATFAAMW